MSQYGRDLHFHGHIREICAAVNYVCSMSMSILSRPDLSASADVGAADPCIDEP